MFYIDTLKREGIGTNAFKLQAFLSEKVVVGVLGCQTAINFGVKATDNQDNVSALYWLPKLHNNNNKKISINQDLLPILVLVQQHHI